MGQVLTLNEGVSTIRIRYIINYASTMKNIFTKINFFYLKAIKKIAPYHIGIYIVYIVIGIVQR